MKYQLVLQVPASSLKDYDDVVALENDIVAILGSTGSVDGHDGGSGEMNIFIDTDEPQAAVERIMTLARAMAFGDELKAAYREHYGGTFKVLKPFGSTAFRVR